MTCREMVIAPDEVNTGPPSSICNSKIKKTALEMIFPPISLVP